MKNVCEICEICFQPGENTKDGKQTWKTLCSNGFCGGCPPLSLPEITYQDLQIGRQIGAPSRQPPLHQLPSGQLIGPKWTPKFRRWKETDSPY